MFVFVSSQTAVLSKGFVTLVTFVVESVDTGTAAVFGTAAIHHFTLLNFFLVSRIAILREHKMNIMNKMNDKRKYKKVNDFLPA
jgi:hypothetical protein